MSEASCVGWGANFYMGPPPARALRSRPPHKGEVIPPPARLRAARYAVATSPQGGGEE